MRRSFFLAGGFLSLGLAAIGALLPVMPTTVFVILAAYCFARSSPTFEARLLNHPVFGPHIRLWREKGGISRKGKSAALLAFLFSIVAAILLVPWPWPLAPIVAAVLVGGWIWRRPEA